jgi:hypothetical protein
VKPDEIAKFVKLQMENNDLKAQNKTLIIQAQQKELEILGLREQIRDYQRRIDNINRFLDNKQLWLEEK